MGFLCKLVIRLLVVKEHTVKLNSHLDITEAKTTHDALRVAMDSADTIKVDASDVERADTAGIQLLLAFKKAMSSQNKDLHWEAPSKALTRSVRKLGLTKELGI